MFPEDANPELVDRVMTAMCDGSPEIGITIMRQFIDYDMGAALAAVDVPIRYINAGLYPTNTEANQRYHPDFSGVVVQDVGHFLMMEKPEVFNTLLGQMIANLDSRAE